MATTRHLPNEMAPLEHAPTLEVPEGELLTITEAAARAGVTRQAISRRVKRGTLAVTRIEVDGEIQTRVSAAVIEAAYPVAATPQPVAATVDEPGPHPPATVAATVAPPTVDLAPVVEGHQRSLAVLADRHQTSELALRQDLERAVMVAEQERRRSRTFGYLFAAATLLAGVAATVAWVSSSAATETRASMGAANDELQGEVRAALVGEGVALERATQAEGLAAAALEEATQAKTAAQDAARSLEAAQSELGALLVQVATERSVRRLVASTATAARLVGELLTRV